MNKQQAAKFLGVSTRAIARYVAKGKLPVTYEKGKTGMQAVFDPGELKKLKKEMNEPVHSPAVVTAGAETALTTRAKSGAVTPVGLIDTLDKLAATWDRMSAVMEDQTNHEPAQLPPSELTHQLTLNIADAAVLSGLTRHFLIEAIHEGKLKAEKRGRGWNIKRSDLDAYIKKL